MPEANTHDPLKIDIHTHIIPEKLPDFDKKYGYTGFIGLEHHKPGCARMVLNGKSFREIEDNCWSPKTRLRDCDRFRVDVQVLSMIPVMFSYWAKPEDTLDLCKYFNDFLAEITAEFPSRFVGLGALPMQAPALAVRELERCVSKLGLPGVEIGTHINDWNLNDENLFPVFQSAEETGAAIFVHPWDMMGKERMPKYWLPWLVGMPAETSLAICSMIFGGVFERLPKLRVAFAHGGGSFPGTIGRIEHGFEVRPDLCAKDNPVNPRKYLDRIYIDSIIHDEKVMRYVIELFGAERIALGSDYPFPLGELEPGKLIETMAGLDKQTRARLLGGTALEWLNLDGKTFKA